MTIETSTAAPTIAEIPLGRHQHRGAGRRRRGGRRQRRPVGARHRRRRGTGHLGARSAADGRRCLVPDEHRLAGGASRHVGLHEVLQLRIEPSHLEPARRLSAVPDIGRGHTCDPSQLDGHPRGALVRRSLTTSCSMASTRTSRVRSSAPATSSTAWHPQVDRRVWPSTTPRPLTQSARPPTRPQMALQRYQDENF